MSAFAAAAAVLVADSHLGQAATYTPAEGAPVTIRVVSRQPEQPIGGLDAPRAIAAALAVMVAAADLPARPARGDAITLGGMEYRVEEVMQDEAEVSYTLHLRRAPPPPPPPVAP